jgi:hypothetical protein
LRNFFFVVGERTRMRNGALATRLRREWLVVVS